MHLCPASLSWAQAPGTWLQMLSFLGPRSDLVECRVVVWFLRDLVCSQHVSALLLHGGFPFQLGSSWWPESPFAPCWLETVFKGGWGETVTSSVKDPTTQDLFTMTSLQFGFRRISLSFEIPVKAINDPACFLFSHFHSQLQERISLFQILRQC